MLRSDLSRGAPFDLILIGRPPAKTSEAAWLEEVLSFVDASLAADGLAYVLPSRLRMGRLRRSARARGLDVHLALAHLPDTERSTFISPLNSTALRYVVDELALLPTWKRLVLPHAYRVAAVRRAFGSVGAVVRRPGDRPCYAWLTAFGAGNGPVVTSKTRPSGDGFFVLHRLAHDGRPAAIAKIRPLGRDVTAHEQAALASLAKTARAAGAAVPESIASATIGGNAVHVLSALDGRLAATMLARRPRIVDEVLERVVHWLVEWARLTARPFALTRAPLEAAILVPARSLAGRIRGGRAYVERLEDLCARTEGRELSLSAAHNDLTMWNVLLRPGGGIGVLDWEAAADTSLPLVDFYYAVVDATAATQRYADRVVAYRRCFDEEGREARRVGALERVLTRELGLERWTLNLAFHACWLHHAANEARAFPPGAPGPFVRILEAVAGGGATVGLDSNGLERL